MGWTSADIPDQSGRTFLVTGATSGLGLETARALLQHRATVILAGRSSERLAATAAQLTGDLSTVTMDLASLDSIRQGVDNLVGENRRIDVLVNNAGIMAPPLGRTQDGFETQIGTNHLGHFALTGLLLPLMPFADPEADARVVTVSSGAHRMGTIDLADLNYRHRRYEPWRAYGQSKLANLLFMSELARRIDAAGLPLISAAAHPGYANTNLQTAGPRGAQTKVGRWGTRAVNAIVAQPASRGVLPQLFAATAPSVRNGDYFGPQGPLQMRGLPGPVDRSARAQDAHTARRLWQVSEELTDVTFPQPIG